MNAVASMTRNAPDEPWTPDDLRYLAVTLELEVAAPRADGDPGRWTPIWVVVVEGEVFVRTWHRRVTGWYGRAVESERAWIRVGEDPVAVVVVATGDLDSDAIDAAYRAKYGAGGGQSMVTDEAAASTLRMRRAS